MDIKQVVAGYGAVLIVSVILILGGVSIEAWDRYGPPSQGSAVVMQLRYR
jgi:hypothetical protein